MGYLVEAFNKMKHMLQKTVPGDVLDNPKKSDSRPASRATMYGKRHDIRRLTVHIYIYIYIERERERYTYYHYYSLVLKKTCVRQVALDG